MLERANNVPQMSVRGLQCLNEMLRRSIVSIAHETTNNSRYVFADRDVMFGQLFDIVSLNL